MKRVRLVDIANRLNITKVSVSKALRDHPDISRETRALVKKTAAEMGYTPNLLARSLSSQRSNTLGVVVPKIAHTFFSSVIDAIQEEATKAGYGIVLAVSNETSALESQHIHRLLAMRVDGLLVSVSKEPPNLETYTHVRDMRVPLVFFDRQIHGLGFSSVTVDDHAGAQKAVDYLVGLGCRRIAHVAGTSDVEIGRARRAGFEEACRRHGIDVPDEWLVEGGFDEWHGYDAFVRIIESGRIPDAVFSVTFPVGLGIRGAMRMRAPELLDRVRIAAFGEGGLNEFYTYPHICVRQPTRAIGRSALHLLLKEIESEGPVPEEYIILDTDIVTPETFDLSGRGASAMDRTAGEHAHGWQERSRQT